VQQLSSVVYAPNIEPDQLREVLHTDRLAHNKAPVRRKPNRRLEVISEKFSGLIWRVQEDKNAKLEKVSPMKNQIKSAGLAPVVDALGGLEDLFTESIAKAEHQGVWAEPQLYLLPFCVPQDSAAGRFRSIKISETVRVNDQLKHRSFRVNPDSELGLPGTFELEVMTGIYKLADIVLVKSGSTPEFIELGSFRSFLELIGRPCTGKYVSMLKEALKRLAATTCISEGFFYSKPRDLYIIESFTFITSLQIAGEVDFNGTTHETTRLRLHEFIRENLNSNFRTLIDFEHLRSMRTSIAKPLCLHLSYRVFKNGKSVWEPDYTWLAGRIGVKVYSDLRRAKEQFKAALLELSHTGFLESWEWLDDGRIRMVAGERLIQKHRERVVAKDAWIAHHDQQSKTERLVPRTAKEAAHMQSYDPLAPLCAEYVVKGWGALAHKARQKGLTEADLKAEAISRGHLISETLRCQK
jgi:hypothetical protein